MILAGGSRIKIDNAWGSKTFINSQIVIEKVSKYAFFLSFRKKFQKFPLYFILPLILPDKAKCSPVEWLSSPFYHFNFVRFTLKGCYFVEIWKILIKVWPIICKSSRQTLWTIAFFLGNIVISKKFSNEKPNFERILIKFRIFWLEKFPQFRLIF